MFAEDRMTYSWRLIGIETLRAATGLQTGGEQWGHQTSADWDPLSVGTQHVNL